MLNIRHIIARDGTALRVGIFAGKEPVQRVCIIVNGHAEFIEKYSEVAGELNARGFTVVTFDWRGQGGSARLTGDPLMGYVGDFSEYDMDLLEVMRQVVLPLRGHTPLLLAHSMGGNIALRALHDSPRLFAAAVICAPMLGIETHGYPSFVARTVTALYADTGNGKEKAWGTDHDPLTDSFEQQKLTSDRGRYERTQGLLKAQSNLRLKGTSWAWIEAAYRSMERINRPGYAEAIKTPILMFGAGHDRVVFTETTREVVRRIPHARYVEIADSEHEMLMEKDAIRARFWKEFDAFVSHQAL